MACSSPAMPHDQAPVLVVRNLAKEREPRDPDRRGRPFVLRRRVENMNRRSERLILQAPKNIHRSVRVNDLLLAETLVRGIDRMHLFVPGHDRNLIIESFCSAKISLSEVWKDMLLNILAV